MMNQQGSADSERAWLRALDDIEQAVRFGADSQTLAQLCDFTDDALLMTRRIVDDVVTARMKLHMQQGNSVAATIREMGVSIERARRLMGRDPEMRTINPKSKKAVPKGEILDLRHLLADRS
jgi:hypothetical protein